MRFALSNSNYDDDILKRYPVLDKYKYDLDATCEKDSWGGIRTNWTIEIKDLETLMEFIGDVKAPIIIDSEGFGIEIYDNWRE